MNHNYYYGDEPSQEEGRATLAPPMTEAAPTGSTARAAVRELEEKPRRKGGGELGPTLIILAIVLVLGATAVLLAVRGDTIPLPVFAVSDGGQVVVLPPSPSAEVHLQQAPLGDGTVLTLEARPTEGALSLQEIYKQVTPAVISIRSTLPRGGAQGTGVVMSADGYIITNAHVIEDSIYVEVSLDDGRTLEAKLVGQDSVSDLAVLKVEADDLIPAVFGNSDDMEVGDVVVAIGNPMGEKLRNTMTDGILSAINRDLMVDGNEMTLLQTTAALNTGNSGGALVNTQGQVIGITNMKLVNNKFGGATIEGLGFAIPTTTVKPIVDSLIAVGYATGRPMLGILVQPLSPEEKTSRGLAHGLIVTFVESASDAAAQGIKAGDVLLTADGVNLDTNQDLLDQKDAKSAGDTIELEVDRAGERQTYIVTLVEQYILSGEN